MTAPSALSHSVCSRVRVLPSMTIRFISTSTVEIFALRDTTLAAGTSCRRAGSSRLLAPMNGVIVSVLAKPDDPVVRGQCIVVLEAMKMQHEILAERDGTVGKILVKPGDQVATRQLLAELKPDEEAAPPPREEAIP